MCDLPVFGTNYKGELCLRPAGVNDALVLRHNQVQPRRESWLGRQMCCERSCRGVHNIHSTICLASIDCICKLTFTAPRQRCCPCHFCLHVSTRILTCSAPPCSCCTSSDMQGVVYRHCPGLCEDQLYVYLQQFGRITDVYLPKNLYVTACLRALAMTCFCSRRQTAVPATWS